MQYRNIKRQFLNNKALKRLNKKLKAQFTIRQINLLFAVVTLKSPSIKTLTLFLKRFIKGAEYSKVRKDIQLLDQLGLINKIPAKVFSSCKIEIGLDGLDILDNYEKILRTERHDR